MRIYEVNVWHWDCGLVFQEIMTPVDIDVDVYCDTEPALVAYTPQPKQSMLDNLKDHINVHKQECTIRTFAIPKKHRRLFRNIMKELPR